MKALPGKPLYVPYSKVFDYNKYEWEEATCVYQVGEHYMFDRDKKVDAENLAWKLDLPLYERKVIFYKEVFGLDTNGKKTMLKIELTRTQAKELLRKEQSYAKTKNH